MKTFARIALPLAAALCIAAGAANANAGAGGQVDLNVPFDPDRLSYRATVPNDVTRITVVARTRHPSATVTVNGGDPDTPAPLAVGENVITVVVTAEDGVAWLTYTVTVTRAAAAAVANPHAALTASFERAPEAHDGREPFRLDLRFSEALGEGGVAPTAASFAVRGGSVKRVRRVEPGLWRVRIAPASWEDVTVTLAGRRGCAEAGAVCAAGGRALSNTATAAVAGPVRIRIAGGRAREGGTRGSASR